MRPTCAAAWARRPRPGCVVGCVPQAQWRATVAARLPDQRWPQRPVLVTAVDARTGAPVVFDRHSEVEVADAVAASCAGGFAYRIGADHYIDGGYRRNENTDLATGYARVLVLSPLGGRARHPLSWSMQLAAQVDELRAGGSRVETVLPDNASEHLFGVSAMDPALRPLAARAGYDQGRALAARLTEFWRRCPRDRSTRGDGAVSPVADGPVPGSPARGDVGKMGQCS